jgi:DNA-binding transcriptional LysR family regulator
MAVPEAHFEPSGADLGVLMDLMSLKYFQFVAMYRNFSKAAEHFYIGQSALSRQIANLEKELGVQLFVRDTRNVRLTEAGSVLYEECDLLLRHHELIFRKLEAAKSGAEGQLSIATVTNFGAAFTTIFQRFTAAYPNVKTRIDDVAFPQLSDSILHGVYDLAFTLDFEVPANDDLAQITIGQDSFVAVMRADYPFPPGDSVTTAELLRQRLIMPRHVDPPVLRALQLAARNSTDRTPGISFVPNTPTAVLRVELGLGISIQPRFISTTAFQGVPIRVCELADLETRFDLVAIYRKDNRQQALLNFLKLIRN